MIFNIPLKQSACISLVFFKSELMATQLNPSRVIPLTIQTEGYSKLNAVTFNKMEN